MPGNNYNCTPLTPRSRLERLLRERELRKSSRYFQPTEDGNKEGEQFCSDSCINENEKAEQVHNEEEVSETVAAARAFTDEQPFKQRLLVVANRLPVSAVREGVDSYHLEISVGGLVSALLGVKEFDTRWIGWPGVNVPDDVGQEALTKALAEMVFNLFLCFWLKFVSNLYSSLA